MESRRKGINLKAGNCLELKDNNNKRRSIGDGRENESQLCDENAESAICKCMRIGIRCFQPRGRAGLIIGHPPLCNNDATGLGRTFTSNAAAAA